jgi:hypothetical protein
MLSIRQSRIVPFVLIILAAFCRSQGHAQAALLMEEPYGFFGILNPTGHNAIYFERICAETPVKLRRCQPGELGAVIARYQGIDGYDWVAIPLLPYLYSVENASEVPSYVDREQVNQLRVRYREAHLESLGLNLPAGDFVRGGWTQLVGAAYERRIYALRFDTTPEQDDALMARMNAGPNHTSFDLLFENCADFARVILDSYFPGAFRRNVFPDAGMTTPKQITYKLVKYARMHPQAGLAVFEIPQIPGYRRMSRSAKGIDESLLTTPYAIPIVLLNPYLAGGLLADYLVRGRYHPIPKHPEILGPDNLSPLTAQAATQQNSVSAAAPPDRSSSAGLSAGVQAPGPVSASPAPSQEAGGANPGLRGTGAANE